MPVSSPYTAWWHEDLLRPIQPQNAASLLDGRRRTSYESRVSPTIGQTNELHCGRAATIHECWRERHFAIVIAIFDESGAETEGRRGTLF